LLSKQLGSDFTSSDDIHIGNKFAFQVINPKENNLQDSGVINKQLIAPLQQVFSEINFGGYRWRTYALFNNQKNLWVIVAERLDIRFDLADKIILKSLTPIIFGIPLATLLIWVVIGQAFKPLSQLSNALKIKRENDLSALEIEHSYEEVEHVVQSTNSLLKRLALSFEREKNFASDVAHELRTPLSILKMDLFNLTNKYGKDNQNLGRLNHSVDRMEHLVQQILTLYRTTPDQFMTTFTTFDLHALSQKVIAEHYESFEKKSQSIELDGKLCLLDGDQAALKVLLTNLIENANKYTPDGGKIRVHVLEKQDSIILQVEDSGSGIPESQHKRIFDRFYRIDGDCHSSNEQGCGLGLSIVKHIVQLHKAHITLLPSSFDTGLLVRVEFPQGKIND